MGEKQDNHGTGGMVPYRTVPCPYHPKPSKSSQTVARGNWPGLTYSPPIALVLGGNAGGHWPISACKSPQRDLGAVEPMVEPGSLPYRAARYSTRENGPGRNQITSVLFWSTQCDRDRDTIQLKGARGHGQVT